jgi:hypothetical protein
VYTIYNFSGLISGTPLNTGVRNNNPSIGTKSETGTFFDDIGNPISPWNDENISTSVKNREITDDELAPPVLNQLFTVPAAGNINFSINYQIVPVSASELQFNSGNWKSYDQVNWSEVRSVLTSIGGRSFINFNLNQSMGLFSNEFTLSGSSTWRDYTYLNEEADIFLTAGVPDQSKVENARRQQYNRTNYSTSYAYNGILRPLYQNNIFSQSSLQYYFKGTLVRSRRYTGGDAHELTPQWGSWVKEEIKSNEQIPGLSSNRISANIIADIFDNRQSLTVSVDVPPLDTLILTNAVFRYWISETRLSFRTGKQNEITEIQTEQWINGPFEFTEILKFGNFSTFTYYMTIAPEENNDITNITSTISLWSFRAFFKASKSLRYRFVPVNPFGGKWEQYGSPALIPNELSFFYKRDFQNINIIKNRMYFSLNIDTSLTFNLQQYTNSNFQFLIGFRFGITGFMELKFSAISENNVIWRYFKNMPGMADLTSMYVDGPQNNVFIDLFDSFNFFNIQKRQMSGFKLKKLELTITHYLGDWRAELGVSIYPYSNTASGVQKYEVTSDISFTVQWKPISEIKTGIGYNGETDRWIRN